MQTSYVREFLETTRTLNYAEAADRLYISHSSLFKHIKALEEDLGGALFDRDGHNITLSEYGKAFLPYAKKLVAEEDACIGALAEWREAKDHNITVASDYRMLDLICRFQGKYPQYHVNYAEAEATASSTEILAKGGCDLALLCDARLDCAEYERILFCKDYMAAVLPVYHPLAGLKTIRLEELAEEDFIALPSYGAHAKYWNKAFQIAGFQPKVALTCARGTAVVECIDYRGGCSVMMENLTRSQNSDSIAIIRLEPEIEVGIDFWIRRDRYRSSAVQAFIDFIPKYRLEI